MNKELQKNLADSLNVLREEISNASDYAKAELPELAESFIIYGRVVETLVAAVAVTGVILSLILMVHTLWFYKRPNNWYEDWDDLRLTYFIFSIIGLIIGGMFTINVIPSLVLVWTAPKMWLIKEIAIFLK